MRASEMRHTILLTVGLACYWPFFRRFEFSMFFTGADAGSTMQQSYATVLITCAACAIVALLMHDRVEEVIRDKRPLMAGIACVGTLGYALLLPQLSDPAIAGASVLLGVGYVALTCLWATALSQKAGNVPLVCIAVSFPISSVLSLAILVSQAVAMVVVAVSPAVSGLSWLLLTATPAGDEPEPQRVAHDVPFGTLGIFCLFIVMGHLTVGALYQNEAFIPASERIITTVLSCITLLLVAYLIARSSATDKLLGNGWVLLAAFYLAAAFLVVYAGSDLYHLGTGIIAAETNCFEIFFWILLVSIIHQTRTSPVLAFCAGFLVIKAIPVSIAKLLFPLLLASLGLDLSSYIATFVTVMTFMLVVATIVFLNARAFGAVRVEKGDQPGPTREEVCAAIAAEAGLSPREEEVMTLISEGHSLKKIGETLFIATGTVQGHAKNVYRKLDVHSKQELIDLVDERQARQEP